MTASKQNGVPPPKLMATRRRRIPAEYAAITALMSTAWSVVGAAQLPVTTWLRSERAHLAVSEPMHQITAGTQNGAACANDLWKPPPASNVIAAPATWHKSAPDEAFAAGHNGQGRPEFGEHGMVLTAMIWPAPMGDVTPQPQIPAPTVKPVAPPVEAPPPPAEQPPPPPRQRQRPPPQQEAPPPPQEAPAPEPEAPAPEPEAPAPPPETPPPPPPQAIPPSPPPGRGHVQLAP
jgi:hypothetical protein